MNFICKLILLLKRNKMIKEIKPNFVFWYITFNGDQDKIRSAMECNWGIENKDNFNKTLNNVNLDDYILCIEKDFDKYSNNEFSLIIKRPV